jgi:predicted ATP-grasp superfamily ATP-dependent carboligase
VRTAVVATKPYDIAQRSRYVSSCDSALDVEEHPESLVEILERRASKWSGWALFPSTDGALAALALHHERLSRHYRVVAPTWEVARHFLDKPSMLNLAAAVGLDMSYDYGPAEEATAARADVRFPVVVKPDVGYRFVARFGCKLFVARDRAELRDAIARLAGAQLQGHVFDLVPGPDSQIYAYGTYLDAGGEPRGGVTVRKLRQSPPFYGVARVAEIAEENALLRDATIAILQRSGFRGMAVAEFKLDPRDGRFRFLEVNGRSVIYNGLLRQAGLDLAALAWSDVVCGRPESARPQRWPGVWINLHSDLLCSTLYRQQDRIGLAEFLAPYRRPKIDAIWSARDPAPFLTQCARTARSGVAALWNGRHRELGADRTRPAVAM